MCSMFDRLYLLNKNICEKNENYPVCFKKFCFSHVSIHKIGLVKLLVNLFMLCKACYYHYYIKVFAIVGIEFFMASTAFYCTLCREFTGDDTCAETHLKSEEHNNKFQVFKITHFVKLFLNHNKLSLCSMIVIKNNNKNVQKWEYIFV